ncbi:MAG: hypothetical protein RL687_218 [Candidatus Parcubacteria bacterium]|jgi:hypothetical protein
MSNTNTAAQTAENTFPPIDELKKLIGTEARFEESFDALCYPKRGLPEIKRVLWGTILELNSVNDGLIEAKMESCDYTFYVEITKEKGVCMYAPKK